MVDARARQFELSYHCGLIWKLKQQLMLAFNRTVTLKDEWPN